MYNLRIALTVLLTLCVFKTAWSQNYCQANLCRNGAQHIGCNNNGALGRRCSANARVMQLTGNGRRTIVRVHNALRNTIATGRLNRYQPAIRMATMTWSAELARLAAMNVRRCILRHDQCRNTLLYAFAGQNAGRTAWRGLRPTVLQLAVRMIRAWFRENILCNANQLANLTVAAVNRCGHFTSMVQEKNNAIGCAILRQMRNGRMMQYITCNYAYNNIYSTQVYRTGTTASNCTTGRNPQFRGLCSVRETYTLSATQF